MKSDPTNVDLFFGDDFNYVKLPSNNGVIINTFDFVNPPQQWQFGTDGTLTLPTDGNIDTVSGTGGFKLTTDGQIQFASGYSIGGSDTGLGLRMATDRGTILFGNHPEPGTVTHFHIMKQDPYHVDLFLGDDFNYVKLKGYENIAPSQPYGVEIGANDVGDQHVWRFGTDGTTLFPNNTILTSNTSLTVQTKLPATYGPFNGVYFESGNGSVNGVNHSGYAGYFFITTINVNNDGTYSASGYPVSIQNGTNPTYTISGVDLGGASPANDCVLSVTTVNDAITNISVSGTSFLPKWTFRPEGIFTLSNGTNIYGNELFQADAVGGFEFNSFIDNIGGGKKTWTFGTDGSLTFPDTSVQTTAWRNQLSSDLLVNNHKIFGGNGGTVGIRTQSYFNGTGLDAIDYDWTFDADGTTKLPDSSIIRTQNWGSFSLKSDNADIVI